MLKIGIETSYTKKYEGNDKYGARFFMQNFFKDNDIELVRLSINKLNKNNKFSEYYVLDKSGNNTKISKEYSPHIIRSRRGMGNYHKYFLLSQKYKIVSSQKISIISNDKYENYLFCKKHQPKTLLLSSFFGQNKSSFLGQKVVIKPIRSNSGKGIELTTKNKLLKDKDRFIGLEELYIVQEFKDFSKGYPGLTKGNHDIRLMFAGKEIIECTLRTPQKGSFKSNIGSGGTQTTLKKKKLPTDLIKLSNQIYKELDLKGDNIMSMDFAYCATEKKRYLIEINSSPGTRYYQTNKSELEKICKGFVKFFKSLK